MCYKTFIIQQQNGNGNWVQVEKADFGNKDRATSVAQFLEKKGESVRVVQISYCRGKETKVLVDHKCRQMEMV